MFSRLISASVGFPCQRGVTSSVGWVLLPFHTVPPACSSNVGSALGERNRFDSGFVSCPGPFPVRKKVGRLCGVGSNQSATKCQGPHWSRSGISSVPTVLGAVASHPAIPLSLPLSHSEKSKENTQWFSLERERRAGGECIREIPCHASFLLQTNPARRTRKP